MTHNFPKEKFQSIPTPFFYYNLNVLRETLNQIQQYGLKEGFHVHYAMKANSNDRILKIIKAYGLGADCVSGNEVKKALEVGYAPGSIAFAGVGKTDEEINYALDQEIFSFNCESSQELEVINALAGNKAKVANIALRINPDVNANTHHYITTGLQENKFGINIWELDSILEKISHLKNLNLKGIHFHIGSQVTDLEVFGKLCLKVNELQKFFLAKNIKLGHINVGGGLGINYENPDAEPIPGLQRYFNTFKNHLKLLPGQQLHFELGRAVVGQCGSLISRVLYIKHGQKKDFVILDAGMTELIRPALYQAFHQVENLAGLPVSHLYDVVGPICESSDFFRRDISLPETRRGDLMAIRSCGAYGEVMSSNYNLRKKAAAIYSEDIGE